MPNKLTQLMFERVGIPNFSKYLDLTAFRHKLVSSNIANVSTPGYLSRNIDFKAELEKMTGKSNRLEGAVTHPDHIPLGEQKSEVPEVHNANVAEGAMNSVDIDREVSLMAQNELLFTIGARLMQRKFDGLKKAITSK